MFLALMDQGLTSKLGTECSVVGGYFLKTACSCRSLWMSVWWQVNTPQAEWMQMNNHAVRKGRFTKPVLYLWSVELYRCVREMWHPNSWAGAEQGVKGFLCFCMRRRLVVETDRQSSAFCWRFPQCLEPTSSVSLHLERSHVQVEHRWHGAISCLLCSVCCPPPNPLDPPSPGSFGFTCPRGRFCEMLSLRSEGGLEGKLLLLLSHCKICCIPRKSSGTWLSPLPWPVRL